MQMEKYIRQNLDLEFRCTCMNAVDGVYCNEVLLY